MMCPPPVQSPVAIPMTTSFLAPDTGLSPFELEASVRRALAEDLGRGGDVTSVATIPESSQARARMIARQGGVVAGLALAEAAFRKLAPDIEIRGVVHDGAKVESGQVLMHVAGPARPILGAERVALNFVGHLSGVATATTAFVERIAHTAARVTCTRKTTPGLRALEKYAVRCGGGFNHRFGLDDAMLIKDNHIAIAGGVRAALARARNVAGHLVKIEIEVDTLEQLREVLAAGGADVVLLDNMDVATLGRAVTITAGRLLTEASGGVTLDAVAAIAETGVDYISSGWITHSAPQLDVALDIAP
jgi:nicotinate-nucleotide pyrophosphorylase (carboxylating)